jgi:uncharacterized protein (TIGR00251 family)
MILYKETPSGILLNTYIQPKASQNKIIGEYKNCLKIQLTNPPIKGAANKACINFLAKEIRVAKSDIKIIKGEHTKQKQILIKEINKEKIESFLKNHS